mmetsp:Transcript_9359/g.13313  ORF Transcript_9359/g.13313 Transcript_9359/m.13313 type:complete len:321 (+) Transcript_9359:174-1136(+)
MSSSEQDAVFTMSVVITAVIQLGGFSVAYALQTEKFYDILGGLNYLALALYSATSMSHDEDEEASSNFIENPRKVIMTILFFVSRSWLLLFLAWRAHERNGDSRFDEVKDKFAWFLVYWVVQGFWVMLISMPTIFVNSSSKTDFGGLLDLITTIGFTLGIALEILSDIQKALWVKAGRQGGFCTDGFWKYSRHPNYFGEIFQWCCAWLFAFGSSQGLSDRLWWVCILSPIFTIHILLNTAGTGVWHAEGKNLKRYYDKYADTYTDYRNRTSILIPMIGYQHVPLWFKRTFLFEWERYEYRPASKSTTTSTEETKNLKKEM